MFLCFRFAEALLQEPCIHQRHLAALRALLLEAMQYVNGAPQPHRIDGTICIAIMVLDDLQDTSTANPCRGLAFLDLPPNWACIKATPIPCRTVAGNSLIRLRLSPHHSTGFIAGHYNRIVIDRQVRSWITPCRRRRLRRGTRCWLRAIWRPHRRRGRAGRRSACPRSRPRPGAAASRRTRRRCRSAA